MDQDMNHMMFFGFGFSAEAIARQLDPQAWTITGTSRSAEGATRISSLGYRGVRFADLASLPDDVTHIVSSVPPDDDGDPVLRAHGQRIAAQSSRLQHVAYLSTTGVYGDHRGAWTDEETPLTPNTPRGQRRLAAEQAWLALQRDHGVPVHLFRLAGIYGPGRNALLNVRAGTAQRIIKPGQVFSRIHVDDIAGVVRASMARPHPGRAYNVADDEPCPPQDVIAHAAMLLGLPVPPDVPFEMAELSPMQRSFYADSKRVSNRRAKDELHYRFRHPTYRDGLLALMDSLTG
jgi:nucleoside-diphosphate-sugar epimerase